MDRKVRFDAAKNGLTIKARILDASSATETPSDTKEPGEQ
jgi:hypothetical protein